MLHACGQRFDVTGNLENFSELNKALMFYTCAIRFDVIGNFKFFKILGKLNKA